MFRVYGIKKNEFQPQNSKYDNKVQGWNANNLALKMIVFPK